MMTSRQRLLATLRHQEPDRYAWAPLIDNYFMQGLPAQQAKAGIVAFLQSIDADILLRHVPFYRVDMPDVTVTETRNETVISRTIQTPLGVLTEVSKRYPEAETDYVLEYPIKSVEDYERVRYWIAQQTLIADGEATQRAIDEIGEDGLVTVDAGAPPLTAFFRLLPQIQLLYEFYDHPEELDKLAEVLHERALVQCRLAAESPAEVVIAYAADITTRLISPALYERYALPFLQDYARELHAAGKIFVLHTCGDVRALLPLMRISGIDAIDSLSEPPLGNTPFEVAREVLGDEICLIGGVNPVILANGQLEALRAHVLNLWKRVPSPHNFLLSTSDATAYGTPVDNLRLVAELVKERGYP